MTIDERIRVSPMGGVGEVGKNSTLLEFGGDMVIVDAGVKFPETELHGVDLVVCDYAYIAERLRIAGAGGPPIFSRESLDAVQKYSKGIPRIVNLLCEHSLINSYAERVNPVPAKVVEEIAREFTLGEFAPTPRPVVRLSADREPGERVEGLLRDMFSYLRPADQPQPLTGTTSRERKS